MRDNNSRTRESVLDIADRKATHRELDRQVLESPSPFLQALPDLRSEGPLATRDLSLRVVHQSFRALQPTASVAVVPALAGRRAVLTLSTIRHVTEFHS